MAPMMEPPPLVGASLAVCLPTVRVCPRAGMPPPERAPPLLPPWQLLSTLARPMMAAATPAPLLVARRRWASALTLSPASPRMMSESEAAWLPPPRLSDGVKSAGLLPFFFGCVLPRCSYSDGKLFVCYSRAMACSASAVCQCVSASAHAGLASERRAPCPRLHARALDCSTALCGSFDCFVWTARVLGVDCSCASCGLLACFVCVAGAGVVGFLVYQPALICALVSPRAVAYAPICAMMKHRGSAVPYMLLKVASMGRKKRIRPAD